MPICLRFGRISRFGITAYQGAIAVSFLSLVAVGCCLSQSTKPIALSGPDSGVVIPRPTGTLGQSDALALAELKANITAASALNWSGMQGTGTISYGPQGSESYPVTLSYGKGHRFRLDVQTTKGVESTRIDGLDGKLRASDGRIATLDPDSALAGIFPFELPFVAAIPNAGYSIIDHGSVNVGTASLHRITLELGSVGLNPATKKRNTSAVDFYFDPASHLLVKSAAYGYMAGSTRARFLTVVSYSDYRPVGTTLIPFHFVETIEGQLSRVVQLSSVQLNPSVSSAYFEF